MGHDRTTREERDHWTQLCEGNLKHTSICHLHLQCGYIKEHTPSTGEHASKDHWRDVVWGTRRWWAALLSIGKEEPQL